MSVSQNYSEQRSAPVMFNPFGGRSFRNVRRFENQFARPFAMGFGMNQDPRFERQLARGVDQNNPMAQFISGARGAMGQAMPNAQALSSQITNQANAGYNAYEQSVNDFMSQLPGFQSQASDLYSTTQAGFDEGAQTLRSSLGDLKTGRGVLGQAGRTLEEGLGGVREGQGTARQGLGVLGQAGGELDTATGYGRRSAEEAFSPLQSRALYQEAARRAMGAGNEGSALTGMVGQGGEAAAQQDMLTQLALGAMQNEGENQRQATGLLGELAGRRGELGSRYGDIASRQGVLGQQIGEIGGRQTALGGAYGDLGAQQANIGAQQGTLAGQRGQVGNEMLQGQADLAAMGPAAMQQLNQALPQLFASLVAGGQLPMQTAGMLQSFLSGQFQPTMDLAELTKPQMGQKSKGFGGGGSVGKS